MIFHCNSLRLNLRSILQKFTPQTSRSISAAIENPSNMEVEEITIKLPWGQMAGKWWGSKSIRPIVCMHGRGDNAGTFDRLIPLLPQHLSYLAIDAPGHGLSSHIPHCQMYTIMNFVYWMKLVQEHFKWEKMSLMGHSMGAAHCFLYAGLFPNRCDLLILLDTLKPLYGNANTAAYQLSELTESNYIADIRNQRGEPPSFTVDEIIEKLTFKTFYSEISEEAAPFLLRGLKESTINPGKYYLPFDRRIQKYYPMISPDISNELAKGMKMPFCFVKTLGSKIIHFYEKDILDIVERSSVFEKHLINGDHHIHLNDPRDVGRIVSEFLLKYSQKSVELKPKL